jgi:DNA-binding response OmpR family regulator
MLPQSDRGDAPLRRILVIDDSREVAESYALLAQEMGHQSAFATNGDSALEFAARMRPDIVILDLVLPDIEGHDLARQLRALPGMANARIYVVSGYGTDEDRRLSREAGCAGHFIKPLHVDVFEALLRG